MKKIVKIALSALLLRALVTMAPAEDLCVYACNINLSPPNGWTIRTYGPCHPDNQFTNTWSGTCIITAATNCVQAQNNASFSLEASNPTNASTNAIFLGTIAIFCSNGKSDHQYLWIPAGSPVCDFWFISSCTEGVGGQCGVSVCSLCGDSGVPNPEQ